MKPSWRARLTAEREQLDSTNIRVISEPVVPRTRSWPPSVPQASLFGLVAGLALGVAGVLGYGIVRDIVGSPGPLLEGSTQEEWRSLPQRRSARDEMTSLLNKDVLG